MFKKIFVQLIATMIIVWREKSDSCGLRGFHIDHLVH